YGLARRRIGEAGALLALALYALDPNLLAHASLATLDMPLAAWSVLALAAFDLHLERRTRASLGASGVFLGLAVASKTPGLLLVPVFLVLGARRGAVRAALASTGLAGLLLLAIYAALGEPLAWIEAFRHPFFRGDPPQASPGYAVFFWGAYASPGFYLYYLGAMALKTPLPTIALLGLGAFGALRRRKDLAWLALLPPLLFVGVASIARRDLGLRYVLPAYPFLFLLAGTAVDLGRAARAASGICVAWLAVATVRACPDFLPYFNEGAGGARGGIRFLDDSNVDWGQDLRSFSAWVRAERPPEYRFLYFGAAEPPYYGLDPGVQMKAIDVLWPSEGVPYAVSAHLLQRPDLEIGGVAGVRFRWLDRFEPERTFGDSIYLYRLRFGDGTRGTVGRLEWLEGGVRQAEEILSRNPASLPETAWLRGGLAAALREASRLQEAAGRAGEAAAARARAEALERSL
ncbi:MAG: phospholipid carrier-dependent glycosyltransferase, partial [Planctomycetota bacterium]